MDMSVRVISDGEEVDSITRSLQIEHGVPTVEYRGQYWKVIDGCINLDKHNQAVEVDELKWAFLVTSILPKTLPSDFQRCKGLMAELFRGALPEGVVIAAAHLSGLGLEQQARLLLVDFLKEKRDATKLYKVLKMKLLFRERSNQLAESMPELEVASAEATAGYATINDFDWQPSYEVLAAPTVDDFAIRKLALEVQSGIGSYQVTGSDVQPLDLGSFDDDLTWGVNADDTTGSAPAGSSDAILVSRLAALGEMAVELLAYFADNPGDRAVHAEHVLGYPLVDINRLLNGSLGFYTKRAASGGWECHTWALDVLSALVDKPR